MAEQKLTFNYVLFCLFGFFFYCELKTAFQELHTNMHLFYGQILKAVDL